MALARHPRNLPDLITPVHIYDDYVYNIMCAGACERAAACVSLVRRAAVKNTVGTLNSDGERPISLVDFRGSTTKHF